MKWCQVHTLYTDPLILESKTFLASVMSEQLKSWILGVCEPLPVTCRCILAHPCAGRLLTSDPWFHTRRGRALHYGEGCFRLCWATDQLRNLEERCRAAMMKPVRLCLSTSELLPPPTPPYLPPSLPSLPFPPSPSPSLTSSYSFLSPTSSPSSLLSHLLPHCLPTLLPPHISSSSLVTNLLLLLQGHHLQQFLL